MLPSLNSRHATHLDLLQTTRRTWLQGAAAGALALAAPLLQAQPAPFQPAPPPVPPMPNLPAPKAIRLFGAKINYYELGKPATDKPTLVLLHGLGTSARHEWGRVMPALGISHHVLALDHLGFGQSDKPNIPYGIQTWVDLLGEFLRQKKVSSFVLVGESLGGWIALQYAVQALQGESPTPGSAAFTLPKPERLVLCDSAGYRAGLAGNFEHKPTTGTGISLAGQQALLKLIYRKPAFATPEAVAAQMQATLTKGDGGAIASVLGNPAILNEAIDGKLGTVNIPALVVWGEHDAIVPLALGQRMAAELPQARLVVIPGAGHAPMIETPQAFVAALRGFLRGP